ncbi:GNAT family N-acetyltransferase [Maribacter sp. ACAM166]|uniref:GNAT family N-acetyltransferase n=1 Tax=Maribacter sp. ACAM166 TaxID=2508996 RepID=UPI0010FE9021|nr:GNAT family N-acetyltransferase [Maribacter sp. ACAM166]TLP77296.1 GNAT family N-acetyltransferase [Maribacter sp. ACAM166]
MVLKYRKCKTTDLNQLIQISQQTFVEAFEKDNNRNDFANYIEKAFSENSLKGELANTNTQFYFVYNNVELVAYFKLNVGTAQTDVKLSDSLELERIYVLSIYQGMGLGAQLLVQVKNIAIEDGKNMLWLGVWEKNVRAIQFYQRHGFQKFGTHPYFIGLDEQTDWLMRFDLGNL